MGFVLSPVIRFVLRMFRPIVLGRGNQRIVMISPSKATSSLNIAAIAARTQALGPGMRAAVWVQGCPFSCPGCVAPNWIPFREATLMSVDMILEKIEISALDGITFSGGEPMAQAEGLASLAHRIKAIKDLDIICFTGYRYERLLENAPNPGVQRLLGLVDVLIDGPYIASRNDSLGLRGSSNQRIIYLTSRLQGFNFEAARRTVEISVTDGELSFVGIPTPAMRTAVDLACQVATERMAE